MIGCVLSQVKPSEFYILSCGKGRGQTRLTPSGRPATRLQSSKARLQVREKAMTAWQSDLCTLHWSTETRQSSHCLSASGETRGDCHGNRARQGFYRYTLFLLLSCRPISSMRPDRNCDECNFTIF